MEIEDGIVAEALALRHRLHRRPEVSGAEAETAREVAAALRRHAPDRLVEGLGGHGIAAVYEGAAPGPTVLFRAELDALPIEELSQAAHRSEIPGRGHLCGHDGHSAILTVLAAAFARRRPARGRVVLLFQPAEETGAGAASVLADPRFAEVRPDYALSLHNLPGLPLGAIALRDGPANCASRGLKALLTGRTAHASMPWDGVSPMGALSRLLPALTALGSGGALREGFSLVTVTHARLGEAAFGIAPGHGEVWATLRTLRDEEMAALVEKAEALLRREAAAEGLALSISYEDVFRACDNHPEAAGLLRRAMDGLGLPHAPGEPMYPSEDFGRFGDVAKSAMFFLGAGEDHPRLHNPDYDFPDALIPVGASIFLRTARDLLG